MTDLPAKRPKRQPPTKRNEHGLTALQEALLKGVLDDGLSPTAAGEQAGYASSGAASNAWNCKTIQAEFDRRLKDKMRFLPALAVKVQRDLLATGRSEKVRADVAAQVIRQSGLEVQRSDGVSVGAVNIQINLGSDV